MARTVTSSMTTEITAQSLRPVMFYEGQFVSGYIRLWTGIGDLSWNGYTWTGAGTLMGITPIEETGEIRATGIEANLSGVSASLISLALSQCRYGLSGKVWFGVLTASGTVVSDPILSFVGKLDMPRIQEQGDNCVISVSYESRLIDLQRSRERRYTNDDQHIDYPADRGFEYVADLQDKVIPWGSSGSSPAQSPATAGGASANGAAWTPANASWEDSGGGGG